MRNKEKYKENSARWKKENPEKSAIMNKKGVLKFRTEKRERFNELMRNQYRKHKQKQIVRGSANYYRKKILEHFNHKCGNCGGEKHLEIHHKKYSKEFDLNDVSCLCRKCHKDLHKHNIYINKKNRGIL